MRKAEREVKDFDSIADIVRRCDTVRLAMNDEGAPYIVPLSFGYEVSGGKIVIYVHGATEGKRHELAARDPRVAVEGDICHGFVENGRGGVTCDYESFIGYGSAVLVSGEKAEKGIRLILEHCGYPEYRCAPHIFAMMTVYRITLEKVTGKRRFP